MRLIDIWHDELRKRGITNKQIEDGMEFADEMNPEGAKYARWELSAEDEIMWRKILGEAAEAMMGNYLKQRQ